MQKKTSIGKYLCVLLMFVFTVQTTIAQKFSMSSYIDEYKGIAAQLMEETGVPASVILGVAIHESAYGNSRIAKYLNNHFGVKGRNNSKTIRSAYKGYQSVKDSYQDFVGLLKRRRATAPLFDKYAHEDHESWIKGIARSGYSETRDWSAKVLSIIDRYDLDSIDEDVNNKAQEMLATRIEASETGDILLREMEKNISSENFTIFTLRNLQNGEMLADQKKVSSDALKRRQRLSSSSLSIENRSVL